MPVVCSYAFWLEIIDDNKRTSVVCDTLAGIRINTVKNGGVKGGWEYFSELSIKL
jgi:hypothetical protein